MRFRILITLVAGLGLLMAPTMADAKKGKRKGPKVTAGKKGVQVDGRGGRSMRVGKGGAVGVKDRQGRLYGKKKDGTVGYRGKGGRTYTKTEAGRVHVQGKGGKVVAGKGAGGRTAVRVGNTNKAVVKDRDGSLHLTKTKEIHKREVAADAKKTK